MKFLALIGSAAATACTWDPLDAGVILDTDGTPLCDQEDNGGVDTGCDVLTAGCVLVSADGTADCVDSTGAATVIGDGTCVATFQTMEDWCNDTA